MKPDAEWSGPCHQAQLPSQRGPCGPAVSSFYGQKGGMVHGLENVGMMSAFGPAYIYTGSGARALF